MSIFLLETEAMSTAGETVFNHSVELLDLSETVAGYAVETDTFDFASAKNKIAENINKMQIKTSNIAQVISFAADIHTAVQSSIQCQASSGLEIKTSDFSATGTSKPSATSENTQTSTSTPTTTVPQTTTPTVDNSTTTDTTQPNNPPENNTNVPSTGGNNQVSPPSGNNTPSVVVPPSNNNQPEQSKFVNYYIKDFTDIAANSTSVVTTGGASTAMAMVLSAINEKEITPVETTEWGMNNNAEVQNAQGELTYFDNIAKAYNVECETMDLTKENILKNISEGKYMILSMDEGKFGNKGNYVVITGITEDGKIKIADPNSLENSEKTWDLSIFLEQGLKLWGFSKPIGKNS